MGYKGYKRRKIKQSDKNLGILVKNLRMSLGLTQKEVNKMLPWQPSYNYMSQVEQGCHRLCGEKYQFISKVIGLPSYVDPESIKHIKPLPRERKVFALFYDIEKLSKTILHRRKNVKKWSRVLLSEATGISRVKIAQIEKGIFSLNSDELIEIMWRLDFSQRRQDLCLNNPEDYFNQVPKYLLDKAHMKEEDYFRILNSYSTIKEG